MCEPTDDPQTDPQTSRQAPGGLHDVVEAMNGLLASFDRAEDALFGCDVPVDLIRVMKDLRRVRNVVAEHGGDAQLARDVIEQDLPLATTFNRDGVPWPRSHQTLSPRDIRLLSRRAGEVPADQLTTYTAEIGEDAVPPLARVPRPGSLPKQGTSEDEAEPQPKSWSKPALEVVPGGDNLNHRNFTGMLSRLADGFKPDYGGDPA